MNTIFDNTILIVIIPAVLSFAIAMINWFLTQKIRKEQVIVAEAGKVSDMNEKYQPYVYMNPIKMRKNQEHSIEIPSDFQRVIVHGHCMEPRGIMDCSQLLVQNINQDKDFSLQVKHDDILLIYLADKDIYKLRVFDKYTSEDSLLTFRYNPNTGDKIISSKPHSRNSVVGVVKYVV